MTAAFSIFYTKKSRNQQILAAFFFLCVIHTYTLYIYICGWKEQVKIKPQFDWGKTFFLSVHEFTLNYWMVDQLFGFFFWYFCCCCCYCCCYIVKTFLINKPSFFLLLFCCFYPVWYRIWHQYGFFSDIT